ncbi:MAG: YjbQ family protein [Candidatus Aminicenantes bacterium]|nr:YjbQ family protein [Candidatus Aminicenantes bacterium]
MIVLEIRTRAREELVDITSQVREAVRRAGCSEGLCFVYVPHTTAAVTINECADPDVAADILTVLKKAVPDTLAYRHGEGNSSAHAKTALVGSSAGVIVENGSLALGTWQGVFLCEFDGPRNRKVWVRVLDGR